MPRHPPIALKTLDRSHCQCPSQVQSEGLSLKAQSRRIVASAKSCAGFSLMPLAQKDQLLEIGSRVRLGKPIICGRLSVSRDKSHPFRDGKFEQIFSLRCQTEQAESQKARRKLYTNDFFSPSSHPLDTLSPEEATILRIARRQSCGLRGDGGAGRDRTDDILLAKQALSQLSYGPLIIPL
jgi:hypothetical protein